MGDFTQCLGHLTHPPAWSDGPAARQPARDTLDSPSLTTRDNIVSSAARGLHNRGRRRATGGPTGCAHPISRAGSHWAHHFSREGGMTWTQPEAEVVAVTVEVTAYVATL